MDAISMKLNSQKKLFGGQSNGDSEDRISSLPEDILHHILSFLPTKYVIGTSVLSTRWKYLWTSVPNLDFCDSLFCSTNIINRKLKKDTESFTSFVNRVLFLRAVLNIHKFSLSCQDCDASHLNAWISTVLRHKVKELSLSITIELEHPHVFPHNLFTCESLRVLKIETVDAIEIPSSISFSSLVVLHLKDITFSGGQSIQKVCFSCPVLEEFVLESCVWWYINSVYISAPTLQELKIDDCSGDSVCEPVDCEIKVYAESLVTLKLISPLYYDYSLYNLSSVVNASFNVYEDIAIVKRVAKLVRGICNVKGLTLSDCSIETLSHPDLSAHLLTFSNLVHLSVILQYDGVGINGRQLLDLLYYMPNIESLLFPDGFEQCEYEEENWTLGMVPRFLSHLKLVDLGNFEGEKNDFSFVNFLLKNASALEKMKVKSLSADKRKEKKIAKQLQSLARGSKCVIEFT